MKITIIIPLYGYSRYSDIVGTQSIKVVLERLLFRRGSNVCNVFISYTDDSIVHMIHKVVISFVLIY